MKQRIEDNFEDVLEKAADGLGFSVSTLADRSGLSREEVEGLLAGRLDTEKLRALAPVLSLDPDKLAAMAKDEWHPRPVSLGGLECYTTPFPVPGYEAMTVNNFLIWDCESRSAIAFDTGANAEAMLADIEREQLSLEALFLTHTHRDHVAAYAEILAATDCRRTYTPELEPFANAAPVAHGASFQIGPFSIRALLTNGHSPGGTSYIVEGLRERVAIAGDSIFCLSQGGAKQAHAQALANNREHLLSLPENTIICPGHGPMTTVGEELAHNPFF